MENATKVIEDQIDELEKYRDAWNDIADEYENTQNEIYAASVLGADWESKVLEGRMDMLNTFKDSYIAAQKEMADWAWKCANEQIKAAQEAAKGANGTTGGTDNNDTPTVSDVSHSKQTQNSYWVYKTLGSYNTAGEASSKVGMLGGDEVIKIGDKYFVVKWRQGFSTNGEATSKISSLNGSGVYKRYASGTKNAKPGFKIVSEDEYGDEIILTNDGDAVLAKGEQLYPFEGGETVLKASDTEKVLANMGNLVPIQTDDLWKNFSMDLTPDLSSMIKLDIPDYSKVGGMLVKNNTQQPNVTIGDIHLHEVQNITDFAQALQKHLPNISVQYNGKH